MQQGNTGFQEVTFTVDTVTIVKRKCCSFSNEGKYTDYFWQQGERSNGKRGGGYGGHY